VQIYVVSCVAHGPICNKQGVRGYPTLKFFPAGSDEGTDIATYNADRLIEEMLHSHVDKVKIDNNVTKDSLRGNIGELDGAISKFTSSSTQQVRQRVHAVHRTRKDIYDDAAKSLDYAFRNSIFMTNGGLTKKQSQVLLDWLQLLEKTLPRRMKTSLSQIRIILDNFEDAIQSESKFLRLLSQAKGKVSHDWTASCSTGYTCGLWELFHVMTLGVAEWNNKNDNARVTSLHQTELIPPMTAAECLRNYIEHFFACNECRTNFLKMYDDCLFGRCDRLRNHEWKQLPLWLWEVHNDVNVRLLKESAIREGRMLPSSIEEQRVKWPSKLNCQDCWKDGGRWNEDKVYDILKTEYWGIDEVKKQNLFAKTEDRGYIETTKSTTGIMDYIYLVVLLLLLSKLAMAQRDKNKRGFHKKNDDSNKFCRKNSPNLQTV